MARTKSERITDIEQQIEQLENQRKRLIQQQKEDARKERSRRLYHRMGLFESLLPDTITLTDEQFKEFLTETILSDSARRTLMKLLTQNASSTPAQTVEESTIEEPNEGTTSVRPTDTDDANPADPFNSTRFARRP